MLLQHLRGKPLAGTELADAQVSTIRLKLLKIGGLVNRSARRVYFTWPVAARSSNCSA